ncbi:MAG: hypothetical protein HY884_00825 [Deltaproteobacteria bacterium]|nr:hypothetical protein [Deltaproteobacteria bacterium]
MKKMKRTAVILLILVFSAFVSMSPAIAAESAMKTTVTDAVYGGILGALIGGALTLLTDKPADNLSYIPTGAALGVIGGAVYGIATSGVVQSVGEIEGGKFALNVPTVNTTRTYDKRLNKTETVEHVSLLRVKF